VALNRCSACRRIREIPDFRIKSGRSAACPVSLTAEKEPRYAALAGRVSLWSDWVGHPGRVETAETKRIWAAARRWIQIPENNFNKPER
jgi:hypothetical protein